MAALAVGATGIVFGDIGTSPLYALDQIFLAHGGVPLTRDNILGGISLVIWDADRDRRGQIRGLCPARRE